MPKKPLAALIIAKMKKKPEAEPMSDDESEMGAAPEEGADEGLMASSDEILSAIESGDSAALMEALKAFVEQCA